MREQRTHSQIGGEFVVMSERLFLLVNKLGPQEGGLEGGQELNGSFGGEHATRMLFQRRKTNFFNGLAPSTTLIDTALFPQPVNSKPLPSPPYQPLQRARFLSALAPHVLADSIRPRSVLIFPTSSSRPSPAPHFLIELRPAQSFFFADF